MSSLKPTVSRRLFLKIAGLTGAGALFRPMSVPAENSLDNIPTRPFGRSGIQVSILSLGGMFDIPNNQLLLRQALRWGVTYWDTADCYGAGRSEKGIGKFFRRYLDARQNVFLVSKSDYRDPEGMTQLLDRSLERMGTSYIDLYFIHAVSSIYEIDSGTRKWAEQAKADGKIRLFGFSTHSNMESCLKGASKLGWIDGIMMTYNYRLMHTQRMKAAVAACQNAGIGLTAMKTQGGGQVRTHSPTELDLAGRFVQKGFTDKQAKLKAVWDNPAIASICSDMPNLTILAANVSAALNRTRLSASEMELFKQYAEETRSDYCAGCSDICETHLAASIPVSDIMRYLMYDREYGDSNRARELFSKLPANIREHLADLDYHAAERACPRNIAIGRLVRKACRDLA